MAGSCSKANQKQSQKRKAKGKRYGIKCTRMKQIPMICDACNKTRLFDAQDAYRKGGNVCCITDLTDAKTGSTIRMPNKFRFMTENKEFKVIRTGGK